MKKIIAVLASVFAMNVGVALAQTENEAVVSISQTYCPEGKRCLATNMSATIDGKPVTSGNSITGIAIYQSGNQYVAVVPGHGELVLYQGENCWYFYANGVKYNINNWHPR